MHLSFVQITWNDKNCRYEVFIPIKFDLSVTNLLFSHIIKTVQNHSLEPKISNIFQQRTLYPSPPLFGDLRRWWDEEYLNNGIPWGLGSGYSYQYNTVSGIGIPDISVPQDTKLSRAPPLPTQPKAGMSLFYQQKYGHHEHNTNLFITNNTNTFVLGLFLIHLWISSIWSQYHILPHAEWKRINNKYHKNDSINN